jgi:hypothetical protein
VLAKGKAKGSPLDEEEGEGFLGGGWRCTDDGDEVALP